MKIKHETITYRDELNDEFAFDSITPRKIGKDYVYVYKSLFKKFTRFFWYRLVAFPPAKIYLVLSQHHKIVNKHLIARNARKTGCFIYGNHTHNMNDALIPTMVSFPKSVHVIVHPNNISMPVLGRITPSLGAIPLPDDRESTKNFMDCIDYRIKENKCLCIYPEAHIWPYYTKIRPFTSLSFRYPVQYNVPSFCFVNTYQKRRFSKMPKVVTYVEGPFWPDTNLSPKEQREDLRNRIYETMCRLAEHSNVELIKYVKATPE